MVVTNLPNFGAVVVGDDKTALTLCLSGKQQVQELYTLLNKALNCRREGYDWAFALCDAINPPVQKEVSSAESYYSDKSAVRPKDWDRW